MGSSPFHVLVPVSSSDLAGSQLSLLRLIESSSPERIRFSCWLFEEGPLQAELERRHIPTRLFARAAQRTPWGLWSMLGELRRMRPDAIYLHASRSLALLARLAGIPCLERVNMPRVPEAGGWCRFRLIDRMASSFNTRLLPVSEALARQLIGRGIPERKVTVFRDLIYPEDFRRPEERARVRGELGVPADARLILGVGRLVRQKAPLDFAHAACHLTAERSNDVFVWIGDGPLAAALSKAAAPCGDRFRLLPFRKDIAAVFAAADVYLQTSRWEGLANVVLEAMAAGLAVVATDVDGTAEALRNYPRGRLVPAGDREALVSALLDCAAPSPGDRQMTFPPQFTKAAVCEHFAEIVVGTVSRRM